MLSILIPVYNFDVRTLVQELLIQARNLSIPFEILIEDDASWPQFRAMNDVLSQHPEVLMIHNEINRGRAQVRNHLADTANFPFLIFMDGDAGMSRPDYLEYYWHYVTTQLLTSPEPVAVLGGVAYRDTIDDPQTSLRWHYGHAREMKSATIRSRNPYHAFTPFNMLATKSVFSICRFDESFHTYGFEDVRFATDLNQQKVPVFHVDNALYHDGLDSNTLYLSKVETAIRNLVRLHDENRLTDFDIQNSQLLSVYHRCKKLHCVELVRIGYKTIKPLLTKRVLCRDDLFALDLYKIGYLCEALHPKTAKN